MKKTLFLFAAVMLSLTVFSNTLNKDRKTPLQRLIIDIGATPFQINISDVGTLRSMNFALGYEITKRLDLRFNVDLNTFLDQYPVGRLSENEYVMMTGLSVGFNYNLLENLIFENSSIDILGKFGIDVNDYSEQESLLYDISVRLKLKDLPYVGVGYNHHMFGSKFNSDMKGIYLTFGLEF